MHILMFFVALLWRAAFPPHTGRRARRSAPRTRPYVPVASVQAPQPEGAPRTTSRIRPYAPRVPHTPAPEPYEVPPLVSPVRPYVLDAAHCARRSSAHREVAQQGADRNRLGIAVLLDISERGEVAA